MEEKTSKRREAADIVREKSKAGCLVSAEELFSTFDSEGAAKPETGEAPTRGESGLDSLMAENTDLNALRAKSGTTFYYSSQFMSDPYARMLLRKQEGAAELVAKTVREDSDRYPRPTPLDVFKQAPFDLGPEELLSCLEGMSNQDEFQDISQLTTSVGHVFLYSSKFLDRGYALMLAEWIDVGQFENPQTRVTTMGHVRWVVTEFGPVNLYGKTLQSEEKLLSHCPSRFLREVENGFCEYQTLRHKLNRSTGDLFRIASESQNRFFPPSN